VGLLDILSMVSQILLRWKHFSGKDKWKILVMKIFNEILFIDDFSIIMISIGVFSIAMICAIILIHGIVQVRISNFFLKAWRKFIFSNLFST
jgi:hypothetical protein